jgi:RNA-binding protein
VSFLRRNKDMDFLGTANKATDSGELVVIGTSDIPDIGNPVFDSKNNRIGTVKRIFGPINEPFIIVGVDDSAMLNGIVNKELFTTTRRTQNAKDKRRNRRD